MEGTTFSEYSLVDFIFSVIGVCTFLFDWASDVWVATEFYRRGDLLWFGSLVVLMVLSSALVQMFSWFWFKYDRELPSFRSQGGEDRGLFGDRVGLSCLLHVLQLGFLCRHILAIRQGFRVWWRRERGSEYAVYLTHDISMLRLIETFSESAPQLALMIYVVLQSHQARSIQYVSIAASTTSIAWMVVDFHRSLRSFLPEKEKQGWCSSLVYFLWNLLLIAPRVTTLALFASVLSAYVGAHFLALWTAFLIWAWRQRTDFMDSDGGEWLYRATVGLIWYFSWFNVADGQTRGRSVIYHTFIAADECILLATWWSYRDAALTASYAPALLLTLPLTYTLGLLLKALYYSCFHPTLCRPAAPEATPSYDEPDARLARPDSSAYLNSRMARFAKSFYS